MTGMTALLDKYTIIDGVYAKGFAAALFSGESESALGRAYHPRQAHVVSVKLVRV